MARLNITPAGWALKRCKQSMKDDRGRMASDQAGGHFAGFLMLQTEFLGLWEVQAASVHRFGGMCHSEGARQAAVNPSPTLSELSIARRDCNWVEVCARTWITVPQPNSLRLIWGWILMGDSEQKGNYRLHGWGCSKSSLHQAANSTVTPLHQTHFSCEITGNQTKAAKHGFSGMIFCEHNGKMWQKSGIRSLGERLHVLIKQACS